MLKRFLFFCLTLLFFISATSNVSADNKIIRKKTVRNATITAGNRLTVFAKGKTINTKIMNGGIEDVFAGAVSQNAKVFNGGRLWLAGGKSYGAVVHNGGLMEVREHDNKSSYSRDTKLLSGGMMNVFNHSLSEKITVESKGFLRVYFPKAVISDVTILSGGLVHVWKHGTAHNVYVAPGGVLELREESPVLKGTIRIAGQLKASFDHDPNVSQAKIILDLTKGKASDVYYIENLDFLKNANISVNIAHNQKTGSYKIASGATKWNDKLDITVNGRNVQSIRLWKPVKIAGKYYTLNRINYKFIGLTVSLTPPASNELVPELEISQKHEKKKLKNDERGQYSKNLYECLMKSELMREEKTFVSDAIQEIENSIVGKNIIRLMNGNFDFKFSFKDMQEYRWGTYGRGYISLNSKFLTYKTPQERKLNLIYCASVIVHEMTHALHRRHNIRLIDKNPTWIARIQDVKLRELHCKITQTEVATELARKYENLGYFDKPSASRVVHESKTWNQIIIAKMEEGLSYKEANHFAKVMIARHLLSNKRVDTHIGKHRIWVNMAQCWDVSYGASAMRWESPYPGKDQLNYKDAVKILSWLDANIDIMWLKNNFSYKMQNNVLVGTEGIGENCNLQEEYVICHGFPILRSYHYDGKLIRTCPIFRLVPGKKLPQDGTFVVRFPNGKKQVEYTVADGLLHGFYKEWNSDGKLLFKVPFLKNEPVGDGIITENGKQVQVVFQGDKKNYHGQVKRKQ